MSSTSKPEHAILLGPLEDAEAVPLRRWLGREAWFKAPVVSLRYERDSDRVMFRLIDTPSAALALGSFSAERPTEFGADLFIGFDGTDANAWPTTIALLGFSQHCEKGTTQLSIVRQVVGDEVWEVAMSLLEASGGEREMTVSRDEAARLIRQWSDLVISLDDDNPDAGKSIAEQVPVPTAGPPPANPSGTPGLLRAARPSVSRGPEYFRIPIENSQYAMRQFEGPESTGAGAAMARMSPAVLDAKPYRPLPYGPLARLSDRWAARRDGNNGVPPVPRPANPDHPVPVIPDTLDPRHGLTPYLEIRKRHFLDRAEGERRQMHTELEETYRRLAEIRQEIVAADERAAEIHKLLEGMPEAPSDPARRNVVELQAHEALIHERRRREFEARRARVFEQDQRAADEARKLRVQEARLSETIAARKRILESRVRQLLEHSLRRCGTYKRQIVHYHPEGPAVIPYLDLALPSLPDWLDGVSPDDGPEGTQ